MEHLLFVLDPARFQSYNKENICPLCGFKKEEGNGEHMAFFEVNDTVTWGCRFYAPTRTPIRIGMLVTT